MLSSGPRRLLGFRLCYHCFKLSPCPHLQLRCLVAAWTQRTVCVVRGPGRHPRALWQSCLLAHHLPDLWVPLESPASHLAPCTPSARMHPFPFSSSQSSLGSFPSPQWHCCDHNSLTPAGHLVCGGWWGHGEGHIPELGTLNL